MSANPKQIGAPVSTLELSEDELIGVLQNSLYQGAAAESVRMVLQYCTAARLDPMQKPVHIVPMKVKNANGDYQWRDVIMPGIGLYRIQADRSGTYAGMSPPEFGPERTESFRDKNNNIVDVTFPEWCEITVSKIVGDRVVTFTAREYWRENYATDSSKSDAPNRMWRKRPRGQIAKCAEAQVLRKGWPEVGAAPTAEEMEGKVIDITDKVEVVNEPPKPSALPDYPADLFEENFTVWEKMIREGKSSPAHLLGMISSKYTLNDDQIQRIEGIEQ